MSDWYRVEAAAILARPETDLQKGLPETEVERRLAQYGLNALLIQVSKK